MTTLSKRSPGEVSPHQVPSMLPIQEQLASLLEYAVLAPSTKNTQLWRFSIGANTIGVFADLTRWQQVADRGRRELYISLGCVLENLLVAGDVRRIIVKNEDGETIMELPLTIGVVGALLLPAFVALGAIAALAAHYTLEVERQEVDTKVPAPVP